jgi:hypothetical protein
MKTTTVAWKRICTLAGVLLALAVAASSAQGGLLADFVPEPASPGIPEFFWDGGALHEALGAYGNGFGVAGPGDGELPTAAQTTTGLLVESPFTVPGILGSEINGATGATTFYDCTLRVPPAGIPAAGPVSTILGVLVQPLGPSEFEIWSTDPVDALGDVENPVLLLAGHLDTGVITGVGGADTGATLSATVTYTGGAILDASPYSDLVTGSFSWSLLDVAPPLAVGANANLAPFEANGTGQFSGVPEPATALLMGAGMAGLAALRRQRKG